MLFLHQIHILAHHGRLLTILQGLRLHVRSFIASQGCATVRYCEVWTLLHQPSLLRAVRVLGDEVVHGTNQAALLVLDRRVGHVWRA